MKRVIIIFFLAFAPISTQGDPELKGYPEDLRKFLHPQDRIVTLRAEAEKKAYSNKAILSLIITTEAKQLSKAMDENSALRSEIKQTLYQAGISAENIKSSKFSTSPQYGWFGRKPSSFKAVNRIAVEILEEKHLQYVAAIADESNAIEISDTHFEHTDKEVYEEDIKAKALQKVMKQKEFYEKTLGVQLTPVAFRDTQIDHRATRGAMGFQKAIRVNPAARLEDRIFSPNKDEADPASSFDEVVYKAEIHVDFKIKSTQP